MGYLSGYFHIAEFLGHIRYSHVLPTKSKINIFYSFTGAAGFLVSINRIITKLLLSEQKFNTLLFFGISSIGVAICFILHQIVERTDFIQFYLTLCRESKKIVLEPTEDAGLVSIMKKGLK